ncbi:MAG: DUF6653 family protein [Pseudomonadota bacterium]
MPDQSNPDIGRMTERAMGMDDATWARHANPWSGWTRLSILPLFALAVWSRVWLGWGALVPVVLVAIWTWMNPRLFAEPNSFDNWMSQAVLGERVWLARCDRPVARHHQSAAKLLSIAAGFGVAILAYGLWALDIGFTIAGLILAMGAKLWFLDRMVWLNCDTDGTKGTE